MLDTKNLLKDLVIIGDRIDMLENHIKNAYPDDSDLMNDSDLRITIAHLQAVQTMVSHVIYALEDDSDLVPDLFWKNINYAG